MSQVEANAMEAQLLAGLLGSWETTSPPVVNGERRAGPRTRYPYQQWVAPVLQGELPGPTDMQKVECHDISGGGFSFLAPERPEYESVVVGFGTPPNVLYLQAEVIHVTPRREGDRYVVGCRYVGKVVLRETAANE